MGGNNHVNNQLVAAIKIGTTTSSQKLNN